jgi:hypothetical protein
MPRTAVTVTDIIRAGVVKPAELTVDVANGNELPNDGRVYLEVRNSNASATTRTLTVNFAYTVDGQTITAKSYPVAAGVTRLIGPWDTSNFGTTLQINGDNAELKFIPLRLA